jgi:hypothetical protein
MQMVIIAPISYLIAKPTLKMSVRMSAWALAASILTSF